MSIAKFCEKVEILGLEKVGHNFWQMDDKKIGEEKIQKFL